MTDPTSLTTAIDNASKVANTPLFTTVIDKIMGFRISKWAAEGEVRKKLIHDEYLIAKESGISGIQYIENLRHTVNLIETAVKSSKYINQEKPNQIKMDNDFFWNTMEHAKTISSDEMQELVAKIIAGEYNCPGTYSMSTLQTLKMLGKHELTLFEKTCSLLINFDKIPAQIFSGDDKSKIVLSLLNIDFEDLLTLQSLGLFLPNEMTSSVELQKKDDLEVLYFDSKIYFLPLSEKSSKAHVPDFLMLTNTGRQLAKHLSPKYIDQYFLWLKSHYKIPGCQIDNDRSSK